MVCTQQRYIKKIQAPRKGLCSVNLMVQSLLPCSLVVPLWMHSFPQINMTICRMQAFTWWQKNWLSIPIYERKEEITISNLFNKVSCSVICNVFNSQNVMMERTWNMLMVDCKCKICSNFNVLCDLQINLKTFIFCRYKQHL